MSQAPKSVIHINFMPGELLFDARPIWSALNEAAKAGRITATRSLELQNAHGGPALHIGTRFLLMRLAIQELKECIATLTQLVPDARIPPSLPDIRLLDTKEAFAARDRALLVVGCFLFEFRAFLELMAKFTFGILKGIDREPTGTVRIHSGKMVSLSDKKGRVNPHSFLLYLCGTFNLSRDWYDFLSAHRNSFAHAAAPYCAIEVRQSIPPEYDLLIMLSNISDFTKADPKDYFRVSEFSAVVPGIRKLSVATQKHLVDLVSCFLTIVRKRRSIFAFIFDIHIDWQ